MGKNSLKRRFLRWFVWSHCSFPEPNGRVSASKTQRLQVWKKHTFFPYDDLDAKRAGGCMQGLLVLARRTPNRRSQGNASEPGAVAWRCVWCLVSKFFGELSLVSNNTWNTTKNMYFPLPLGWSVKLLEFSVFARKKCFAPMLFGKNERSVLVFPWPSLKTLAQPITIRPFFAPSIPWNTTAISHKFPKRKHQMPFFKQKNASSLTNPKISSSWTAFAGLQTNFLQSVYKVLDLYKNLTKFWNYNFFTEFLHYKVLTKSTKFKDRNNKFHKVFGNLQYIEFYKTLEQRSFYKVLNL